MLRRQPGLHPDTFRPDQIDQADGAVDQCLDETFHLHLRLDHIHETWAVRKPTKDGHVTSIEAYDSAGRMVIQFFGKRHEGQGERPEWRFLAEHLPRISCSTAA